MADGGLWALKPGGGGGAARGPWLWELSVEVEDFRAGVAWIYLHFEQTRFRSCYSSPGRGMCVRVRWKRVEGSRDGNERWICVLF